MRILHTEASMGWGGQEIRIFRECLGMRKRGHEVFIATTPGSELSKRAQKENIAVLEISFEKKKAILNLPKLIRFISRNKIDIVNTHSSLDSWVAGIAGKWAKKKVVRTRHLSTPVKKGINLKVLYQWIPDAIVTTCQETCELLLKETNFDPRLCLSIPTGVDPAALPANKKRSLEIRKEWGYQEEDFVIGTVCVLRWWKGVAELLQAAKILESEKHIKWVVVGSGVSEGTYKKMWKDLDLEGVVLFTGRMEPPYDAIQAFDVFTLLSRGNEGVSQAVLSAAYLEKPLITTAVGGLKETTIDGKTGRLVPAEDPQKLAEVVLDLYRRREQLSLMGKNAKKLVEAHFTWDQTLSRTEILYSALLA